MICEVCEEDDAKFRVSITDLEGEVKDLINVCFNCMNIVRIEWRPLAGFCLTV